MNKKVILMLVVLVVLISVIFTYFYKYAGDMVTHNVENVENITISMYPYDTNRIIIEDEDEINKIFNMLLQTSDIANNRYPSHAESVQHDPRFEIDIKYNDGKTDNLFASPRTNYIGLFLNTKGSSGDPGYRKGKNQMIWEYILQ